MIFDMNDPRDYIQALDTVQKAVQDKARIEIRRPRTARSGRQNNYYHFMLRYFASEYGCTVNEASEIYMKRQACPHIFEREKTNRLGRRIKTYRSSAELTVEEMSSAMRNFRAWAEMGGIQIPEPDDYAAIKYCERQIERNESMI